jgi:type II secretion system protein H
MAAETSARRGAGGFTGIELLVVLALAGILLAVAWARISQLAPKYRLEGVARSLAADLQKAHGRAIAEGRCFEIHIDTGAKTYRVNSKAAASPCGTGFPADPTDGTARRLDDINTVAVATTADPVFDPRGTVSTTAVITLTNTLGDVRTVFVQGTGRVTVQ